MAELIVLKKTKEELAALWEQNLEAMSRLPNGHRDRLKDRRAARLVELENAIGEP